MDPEYYQSSVVESINQIKRMQQELAVATQRQIELLERLVSLEHEAADSRKGLERAFTRMEKIEARLENTMLEVNNWKVVRQIIAWVGAPGLIGGIVYLIIMVTK